MFASRSPKFPERKRIKKSQTNGGLRSAFIQSVPAHCLGTATALAHMLHEFSSLIQTVTVGIGIPVQVTDSCSMSLTKTVDKGSRTIPPVGNLTLPRRIYSFLFIYDSSTIQVLCQSEFSVFHSFRNMYKICGMKKRPLARSFFRGV